MDGPSLHKWHKLCRFERKEDILKDGLKSKKGDKVSKIDDFETT